MSANRFMSRDLQPPETRIMEIFGTEELYYVRVSIEEEIKIKDQN